MKMNPHTAEQLARQRTAEFRAEAARRRPAASPVRTLRYQTGWAMIQIGLALVMSARRRHGAMSLELP